MPTLGEFIKERRKIKELSKRALARKAGISHTEVHRIENGERQNPSIPVLTALADNLGVAREEMLRVAGYLDEDNKEINEVERAFPEMKLQKQQDTVRKFVDSLARNSDLQEDDYDKLVEQTEMFLEYVKKKNTD